MKGETKGLIYPKEIYFRIVRAGATSELRVDIYRALEHDQGSSHLHHVQSMGMLCFLRELNGGGKYLGEEESLQQPISDLIKKMNERMEDKND